MELEGVTEVQPFDDDFQHYFTVSPELSRHPSRDMEREVEC